MVYGGTEKFQSDPYWRDYDLFRECLHADNGAGLGASHQTGWTDMVAELIHVWAAKQFFKWAHYRHFSGPGEEGWGSHIGPAITFDSSPSRRLIPSQISTSVD